MGLNKVCLIGNLGADPEERNTNNGNKVVNFTTATNETWKDKSTGEKREKVEWHRIVIWNEGIGGIAMRYLHKGSKIYLEGQLQTRSWEKDGVKRYTTEVVLQNFNGTIEMLDGKGGGGSDDGDNYDRGGDTDAGGSAPASKQQDLDDEIPF